jgi:SAM-dependent methyltransferase
MTDNRAVWDGVYQRRGKLWGGGVPPLPDLAHGSRVLELGCGNGKVIADLLGRKCDVVGLDFSQAAITAARSCLPDSGAGNLIHADARNLPFIHDSFEGVISRHILGHMNRAGREQIALEIIRVLRPGGILAFSGFSRDDFRYSRGTFLEDGTFLRGNGISTHFFTREEVPVLFSGLSCDSLADSRWTLRIRGKDHMRSEIHAVLRKIG